MKIEKISTTAQQLVARVKSDPRSASEIARLSGVSQPTISRLRKSHGGRSRDSDAFTKLCSFYEIPVDEAGTARGYNELLRSAIVDAWDGTESHGRALLVVIKGLKGLHAPSHGKVGE